MGVITQAQAEARLVTVITHAIGHLPVDVPAVLAETHHLDPDDGWRCHASADDFWTAVYRHIQWGQIIVDAHDIRPA